MIFQFEIVGFPKGFRKPGVGPMTKQLTVEAPNLLEAYRAAKERGDGECSRKYTLRLKGDHGDR